MRTGFTFYDLSTREGRPRCWSLNPWKARLALNHKLLPYHTEWVEYPDIAPKFKEFGIAPNDPKLNPFAQYSCPAIRFPGGKTYMDSRKIAEELDKFQPEPPLHMDKGELIDRTQTAVLGIHTGLAPIVLPRVPERLLSEYSGEYFRQTRGKRFGMDLVDLAKSDRAGEAAWQKARPHLTELQELLSEKNDGPYVLGKQISFADFVIIGMMVFYHKLDQDGDLFERVLGFDESFQRLWKDEAVQDLLKRDD